MCAIRLVMPLFLHVLGQGLTGLHHAAGGGHPECFHCLLEHGAEPALCTVKGENALDVARRRGKPRVISKASKINCTYMYVARYTYNVHALTPRC